MAKALAKGSRITGAQREDIASQMAERYTAGDSVRKIAADHNRSYGSVHKLLNEAGVSLRGRGGATRGAAGSSAARKTEANKKATTKKASAKKAAAKKANTKKSPGKR